MEEEIELMEAEANIDDGLDDRGESVTDEEDDNSDDLSVEGPVY